METIKKHDFIEIEYTGKIKEDGTVFDTTYEKVAKENDLHGHDFGPIVICVGEEHVLKGIDKNIEGKETGKEYNIELKPEDAFGSKNAKLIQLMPTNKFKQQNIQPMPGLRVNIDGIAGTIKTVSGGRTLIDFNHPLAGKELVYHVKVNKKITDDREKLAGYVKLSLGTKDFSAEIKENDAKVTLKADIPREAKDEIGKKLKELIPSIKKVEFSAEKKAKNK
ncbi:peptidylprolyl isomerase [Candidatus Woesearchaeota archaeon]|nr:peptidylprolyl isomerase [Candidatus Woesearchaeota archaeon]